MFKSFDLLVAPIVALIFFNVYEYTSVGKDIAMPLSWRSALLIGALWDSSRPHIGRAKSLYRCLAGNA
jgi:hypothetical protein